MTLRPGCAARDQPCAARDGEWAAHRGGDRDRVGVHHGRVCRRRGVRGVGAPPGCGMSRVLRVAMVAARALPFMGGIETHVHEVSRRLAASGVDVTVLTTDVTGELSETVSGYRILRWPAYPRPGLLPRTGTGPASARRPRRLRRRPCSGCAYPRRTRRTGGRRRTRTPAVLTFHAAEFVRSAGAVAPTTTSSLIGPLMRSAAALVAVCEFERRMFARIPGIASTIRLIRNGSEPLPCPIRPHPE